MKEIKRCTRCIMDNSADENISFDENGYCNYCNTAFSLKPYLYFPNKVGESKLKKLLNKLKIEGKGKEYDCLMGISGGLDSTYLAYLGAVKWDLRILAVHVDDGFDTDLAKKNIAKLVKKANINLITIVPDKEQFLDLNRAFFYAEVPNLAIPQDNLLLATLYRFAKEKKINYFLSGANFALESILQKNTHPAHDLTHIKAIHKKFGTKSIENLPLISFKQRLIINKLYHIKTLKPLNYIDYNKKRAIQELHDFSGFTYYEAKHLESKLTKIIQLIWFKEKFGVDKRTSHLSSLIVSDQMTRKEALTEYEKPLYDKQKIEEDLTFVLNKLNIERSEFDRILKQPPKKHTDYKTSWFLPVIRKLYNNEIMRSKIKV